MKGRKKENILPVIIVYKKRKDLTKHFMSVTEHDVDSLLNKMLKDNNAITSKIVKEIYGKLAAIEEPSVKKKIA